MENPVNLAISQVSGTLKPYNVRFAQEIQHLILI